MAKLKDQKLMLVHQLLHGYKRGHQLLAGSIRLDSQSDELVTRLSDLSGSMTFDLDVRPYLTCYPLPNKKYYAIGKTWLDTSAPRTGCVLTHTLLIPIENWLSSPSPVIFRNLIDRPDSTMDTERYRRALEIDMKFLESGIPSFPIDDDLTTEFVYRFFGEGISPIVWFTENDAEEYFWRFAESFWSQLRGQFACCTFCLQPRFLDDRPFNLMFAPLSAHSRFHQMQRENIIDRKDLLFSADPQRTYHEPWLRRWAAYVAKRSSKFDHSEDDVQGEIKELGPFLGNDPTTIKKLYLVRELRKQSSNSPMASIGLLDMVESVAPGEDDAISYKAKCLEIALRSIRTAENSSDALKSLFLLSDRLMRKTYGKNRPAIITEYYSIVADYTSRDPDESLRVADRLLDTPTESVKLPYVQGVIFGLIKMANKQPVRLKILRQYPDWSPLLIGIQPELGLLFLESDQDGYDHTNLETLTSWVSKISDKDLLNNIRRIMLPEASDDHHEFLVFELPKILHDDVHWIVDTVKKFTARPVEAAAVVAATYSKDANGLDELLQTAYYSQLKKAHILAAFVAGISQDHSLPKWFCEFAQKDTRLLRTLLPFDKGITEYVAKIIKKILDEVLDLPITQVFTIEEIYVLISSQEYYSYSLVEASMRSAISEYIKGTINWKAYEEWESTSWGKDWISKVSSKNLQLIISRKCSESKATWIHGWMWLANVSQNLYQMNILLVPLLIETLLTARPKDWSAEVTDLWVLVLKRVYAQPKELIAVRCSSDALKFAFHNTYYPVSKVVVQAFLPVYKAVVGVEAIPPETFNNLFGYFDWDRGKELRKKIIDAFTNSAWPPGDLALSAREPFVLRKIYSRLRRHWKGKEYIPRILNDLSSRRDNDPIITTTLEEFKVLMRQNFYETWD